MSKLFYLLAAPSDDDGARLRDALCSDVERVVRDCGGRGIVVLAADEAVSAGRPVRVSDPPLRAMLSFRMDDVAARGPVEAVLRALVPSPPVGYRVDETRPLDYERPIGARTPGMKQVSRIARRPDLARDEFLRRWQGDHERVALETQSTFGYVRNEILETLGSPAPTEWSAIVEESFPIEALTDRQVFFDAASPAEADARLARMLESCRRFMRLDLLEVTFVSEYDLG
jgi:hypothetical protein